MKVYEETVLKHDFYHSGVATRNRSTIGNYLEKNKISRIFIKEDAEDEKIVKVSNFRVVLEKVVYQATFVAVKPRRKVSRTKEKGNLVRKLPIIEEDVGAE